MFTIFMQLYLHMDSGSHLNTRKTRHDGVHVYRNMHSSVGVHVAMRTELKANEHASYASL